jgi:hypothetical protein
MPKRDPEYGETRFVRLKRSFANHTVGVVILAAVAVVGAIGTVIDGGATVAGLFGDDDKPRPPTAPAAVRFSEAELAEEMNERFAFSFRHPTTWEQQGAVNSDGAVFRAPQPATELRAYGVNVADGPTDLRASAISVLVQRRTCSIKVESSSLTISASSPGRVQETNFPPSDSSTVHATPIPVARSPRSKMLTSQGGRDVTIICQVPTHDYKAYAGACNQLVATLQIERL